MSAPGRRLDKLFPTLTAKERGLMGLRALKDGREQDPQLLRTMPPEQLREFLHYAFTINSMSFELGTYLALVSQLIEQLHLQLARLKSLNLWAMTAFHLAWYISTFTKEPVSRSEYERRAAEARSSVVSASVLAETLIRRRERGKRAHKGQGPGTDTDAGAADPGNERVLREAEKEITRLVREGVLAGGRKGQRLLVAAGSFFDWLGEPTPVLPDWATEFEIFPDEEAEKVAALRCARESARETLQYTPIDLIVGSPQARAARLRKGAKEAYSVGDDTVDRLFATLLDGLQLRHRELRAAEIVIEEAAAEFDGEDPVTPVVQEMLDRTKQSFEEARAGLTSYVGESEMPEPDEEDLRYLRKWLTRTEKTYG